MKTIVWHMNHRGFFMNADNIDIRQFHSVLEEIVGNVGDVILAEVYKELRRQIAEVKHDKTVHSLERDDPDFLVNQIENLLHVEIGGGR
jgi:hypothetical protein